MVFARALYALHEAGVLRRPECKPVVKEFIRKVSEEPLWHLSTHYRSHMAAAIIAKGNIKSAAQYHAFCRKTGNGIRHEHMVPGKVVYELITQHPRPSVLAFARILRKTGIRATITIEEDRKLRLSTMPPGFTDPASPLYFNHLARYIEARIDKQLDTRPAEGWFPAG